MDKEIISLLEDKKISTNNSFKKLDEEINSFSKKDKKQKSS